MADDKKKSDETKEDNATDAAIERAVTKALETAIPLGMRLAAEANRAGQPPAPKQFIKRTPTGSHCQDCGQAEFVDSSGVFYACQGKHVKMSVMSSFNEKWFQGWECNGVTYRSNFAGHLVTLPADNEAAKFIENWERQERESERGRRIVPSQYSAITRPPTASNG